MKHGFIVRHLNRLDRPQIIEVSPETYTEIRDQLLDAGYDYLIFPDFGSFSMEGFVIRNRERAK